MWLRNKKCEAFKELHCIVMLFIRPNHPAMQRTLMNNYFFYHVI